MRRGPAAPGTSTIDMTVPKGGFALPQNRFIPTILTVSVSILCLFSFAPSAPCLAQTYWFEDYQRVVGLIDEGRFGEASPLLDRLIAAHPYPIAGLKIPGDRRIDYLPYYQKARIQMATGDARSASHNLDISEAFGATAKNKRLRAEFTRLRQEISALEASRTTRQGPQVTPASDPHQ